jgi:hypothetical protein
MKRLADALRSRPAEHGSNDAPNIRQARAY